LAAPESAESSKFRFRLHLVDTDLEGNGFGQTALADLDGDGRPEFVMGLRGGELYVYKVHAPDRWTRHVVGADSPSDVGLTVLDVDGDGFPDLVAGGAWYRNSGSLARPYARFVFDPELEAVHDIVAADVDGDGRIDILTMSDRNNLRWYAIPDDPSLPWRKTDIGEAVHAGLSVGDLNGTGFLDVVRTDVWFENVNGDGRSWRPHPIGPNISPETAFRTSWENPGGPIRRTRWAGSFSWSSWRTSRAAEGSVAGFSAASPLLTPPPLCSGGERGFDRPVRLLHAQDRKPRASEVRRRDRIALPDRPKARSPVRR
jgi:hypothetical protein